nr:GAF domain-containing protein [Anaerolineae bacterium]
MVQSSQPAEQAASRSKRILYNVRRWLVEPSPAIVDPEEQRRAQLRALVLLLASPFFVGMIFLFLPYISRQDGVSFWEEPFNLVVIGYTIGLCLAYALSRTRYSLIGGVFGLAISAIAFLAGVYLKPATLSYESIVVYLIILFALCSFFFTLRQMVWVGLGYLLVMALAAILSPQMVAAIYYSLLPLALLVPIFSLLYMLYRDQQEAARQEAFEKNAQRTEALFRISQVISSTLRRDDLFRRIASQMGQAVDATSAYICSFDPDRMESTVLAEYYSPNACPEELVSDLGDTYAEGEVFDPSFIEAMKTGGHDYSHIDDPDLAKPEREHLENYGAKTVLYIPLLVQGRLVGYAELWESRRRREFSPEQIALCHSIAQQAAVALE